MLEKTTDAARRDPVASLVWRSLNLAQRLRAPFRRAALRRYDSRLPVTAVVHKAVLIIGLLERYRPRHIVELGSGESTAWFASYASKHPGTRVTSIDQNNWNFTEEGEQPEWWNPQWQEQSTKVACSIGGVEFIQAPAIQEPPNGWRYDLALPADADFVLVDGPYHRTMTAGMDVPLMIQRGHKPKVICYDGRTTGVDVLRTMAPDYDFYPQMHWCFERKRELVSALAMRGQSVFIRRD